MGHGSARIARAAGVREMTIRALVRGDARTISPQLRDTITAVYDAWWDKRAPGRTRAERGAATLARRRAIAGNWCAAAALDDDQLDTPGYRPRHGLETRHRHRHRPRHPPGRPAPPQEEGRMTDHRIGLDLFIDVLDVLHRHGFARGDIEHQGRAISLISDLARIYEGTQDHPVEPSSSQAPAPPPPGPPGPDSRDAVIISASSLKTVLIALDIAADDKRDRAEMCTDCPDQSCPDLPDPPPRRPGLRPAGRPDAPGRRSRPGRPPRPGRASRAAPSIQPRSRQGGRPVTIHGRTPDEPGTRRQADDPRVPAQRPGDKDLREMQDPYDLPFPDSPTAGHQAVPSTRSWSTSSAAGSQAGPRRWPSSWKPDAPANPSPTWKPNHDPDPEVTP